MTWKVADPKVAAIRGVVVQEVEIVAFPDDADALEAIVNKALDGAAGERLREKPVILVTPKGFVAMHQLSRTADLLGPAALADQLLDLAKRKELVCFRWA